MGTRTFLELRVGRSQTVDVLLHLRRDDVEWFHSSPQHKRELFRLISQHILPNECEKEIEQHNNFRYGPPEAPVEVGEKNKPQRGKKGGRKRKGAPKEQPEKTEKPKRQVRNVYGDGMQVVFQAQETKDSDGATLIFPKKEQGNESKGSPAPTRFRQLPKLSKRIVLWCYPKNDKEAESSPERGGGFPRPEMVPITSLFRAPPTEN